MRYSIKIGSRLFVCNFPNDAYAKRVTERYARLVYPRMNPYLPNDTVVLRGANYAVIGRYEVSA